MTRVTKGFCGRGGGQSVGRQSAGARSLDFRILTSYFCIPSVLHNRRKRLRVQAGSADQGPIDFFLRHQGLGILRLHRAAIEDAEPFSKLVTEGFCRLAADELVSVPLSRCM